MNSVRLSILVGLSVVLTGCLEVPKKGTADLDQYLAEIRSKPKGAIEPLPEFMPYQAFNYSAFGRRSPFQPPVKTNLTPEQMNSNIKPDENRKKEYLEQFEVDSFALVGFISNDEGLWGLVQSDEGVHRVQVGDYMGRNHGRIVFIDEVELRLVEIVPAGSGYWLERPRTIRLRE